LANDPVLQIARIHWNPFTIYDGCVSFYFYLSGEFVSAELVISRDDGVVEAEPVWMADGPTIGGWIYGQVRIVRDFNYHFDFVGTTHQSNQSGGFALDQVFVTNENVENCQFLPTSPPPTVPTTLPPYSKAAQISLKPFLWTFKNYKER
jgi:hypothetical protein